MCFKGSLARLWYKTLRVVESFLIKSTKKYLNRRFTNATKCCIMVITKVGESMSPKKFGSVVARLRKKYGYTQMELAEKLNLSDKTISKWESGLGYPDIAQLPALARLFGVTIDYLLSETNVGITIAGCIIADVVKTIDKYPALGMCANVRTVNRSVGGCVPNTAIDLATIDPTLPISAVGLTGEDDDGRFIISEMQKRGINVSGVRTRVGTRTGFSDVMSLPQGERTFFSCRGVNSDFSFSDIDIHALNCRIFHIGYILYLDKLDAYDAEYGTKMARLLKEIQERGIKTSVDMLSGEQEECSKSARPAFAYCDYVIINEVECCNTWGLSARRRDGSIHEENIRQAMRQTMGCGVREKVIVHAKEKAFCLNKDGAFTKLSSLILPKEKIKGSVGAGDAFCAGSLYAIYNCYDDLGILEFASAAAAYSLFADNSVDGMKGKKDIEKLMKEYARYE